MFGVKAQIGMGLKDLGQRNPPLDQMLKPHPRHPALLAPTPKRTEPAPDHLEPKAIQTSQMAGYRLIVEVTPHNGPQPFPDFGHRQMPASSKLLLYLFQLCSESLADGLANDEELAGLPGLSTDVGEA